MMTTPSPSKAYLELFEAIVKAVPECLNREWNVTDPNLEDVLKASIGKIGDLALAANWPGVFIYRYPNKDEFCYWHLGYSLEWHRENAPETVLFLHSLLCVQKSATST